MTDHDSSVLNAEPGVPAAPSVVRRALKFGAFLFCGGSAEFICLNYTFGETLDQGLSQMVTVAIAGAYGYYVGNAPQPNPASRPTSPNTDEPKPSD